MPYFNDLAITADAPDVNNTGNNNMLRGINYALKPADEALQKISNLTVLACAGSPSAFAKDASELMANQWLPVLNNFLPKVNGNLSQVFGQTSILLTHQ